MKRGTPMEQLLLEMRTAARHAHLAPYRECAAREADRIATTHAEIFHTKAGELAKRGRALMRELASATGDEIYWVAQELLQCAAAIQAARAV